MCNGKNASKKVFLPFIDLKTLNKVANLVVTLSPPFVYNKSFGLFCFRFSIEILCGLTTVNSKIVWRWNFFPVTQILMNIINLSIKLYLVNVKSNLPSTLLFPQTQINGHIVNHSLTLSPTLPLMVKFRILGLHYVC